jgi:hypothetical protein
MATDDSADATPDGTPEGADVTPDSAGPDSTAGTPAEQKGMRERVTQGGEEAIGKLAQELLQSPVVTSAISSVFATRERASRAQEAAMGALNLPSASDIERLTRRLRGVSQRLEGLEDGLDRVGDRLDSLGNVADLNKRLEAIEASLARIEAALGRDGS